MIIQIATLLRLEFWEEPELMKAKSIIAAPIRALEYRRPTLQAPIHQTLPTRWILKSRATVQRTTIMEETLVLQMESALRHTKLSKFSFDASLPVRD
jgi:hypothetical protein